MMYVFITIKTFNVTILEDHSILRILTQYHCLRLTYAHVHTVICVQFTHTVEHIDYTIPDYLNVQ